MKFSALGFLLLFTIAAQSQSSIEDYLSEITKTRSFTGSVIVTVKDKVLINKGFGKADYELNVANTSRTVHRIGSLTKQFTSMGILKLFENDSLSLDDSLSKFIPDLPAGWKTITLFHLLTHTSGIPNYFGEMDAVPVEDTYKEIEKVIEMERKNPRGLNNVPGQEFRYSNFGYAMLGHVIERVSRQTFFDYLKNVIFDPLGMDQTFYDDPRMIITNRSEGYKFSDGRLVNDALKDPAGYSTGGILSSANDLLKWLKALNSNAILGADTRRMMFYPFLNNYGLGWQILEKNGKTMYNHNGGTHGYDSRIVYYPKEEVFIAILGNNEDVRSVPITCDIEALIFEEEDAIVSLAYSMEKSAMEKFQGSYRNPLDGERSIQLLNDVLFYINGEAKFELVPIAENVFCLSKYKEFRIQFSDDDTFTLSTCSVNPRMFNRE